MSQEVKTIHGQLQEQEKARKLLASALAQEKARTATLVAKEQKFRNEIAQLRSNYRKLHQLGEGTNRQLRARIHSLERALAQVVMWFKLNSRYLNTREANTEKFEVQKNKVQIFEHLLQL